MEQSFLEIPSCSLKFEHKASYLHALANGKRENQETCKQIWKQILSESKSKQFNKILFERNIEGIGTISELRKMIAELSTFIDGEYIALVDKIPDHFQTNRLTEVIAGSFDLHVEFFPSVGEAKEWLLLK